MRGKGQPWPMIEVRCAVKTSFGMGFVSASAMFLAVGMYLVPTICAQRARG